MDGFRLLSIDKGRGMNGVAVGTVGAEVSGTEMGSNENNIAHFMKSFDDKVWG
jgi:hypothetical protein